MYAKRIKILVAISALLSGVCLLRLMQMQLLSDSFYRNRIAKLKIQKGQTLPLKTVRGRILDRKGKVLATDEPQFELHINYSLTRFMDDRVREAVLIRAAGKDNTGAAEAKARKELDEGLADLNEIILKCAQLGGCSPSEIKNRIQKINDVIWKRRVFQAWRQKFPDSDVFKSHKNVISIPDNVVTADFEKREPNPVERLLLVNKVEIAEMRQSWPLAVLDTDDDIFTAQLEFADVDGVEILAKGQLFYPYGPAAAQTIGWVGPATQEADRKLFADDNLWSYQDDEVCGREDGIEYACETVLRGRRGRIVYGIDRELVDETKAQLGQDVSLTIDIELQQKIEKCITDCDHNPNCRAPSAAVVIDVASGEILALVSTPVFDLNRIRQDYAEAAKDPHEPMRNRAINKQYPPGSAVKPVILIAGMESGKITASEVISCPAEKAPRGWPNCWLYNRYQWRCHNDEWANYARNAIKGSCNIYFSRLADRIEPLVLQQWLYKFGYGHISPLAKITEEGRDLRQAAGQISTATPQGAISSLEQLPPLAGAERRFFGIGQGGLRVTPLQAANAMAAIARGGIYKAPRILLTSDTTNDKQELNNDRPLGISANTLNTVREGMSAVVNEPGGTAYNEFVHAGFSGLGVKVYGKTGSTEAPENAWFCGFAEDISPPVQAGDGSGRKIAIAVLVEGGQHGSSDAGPLVCDILHFCIEAGYIGNNNQITE
jgi:penicillin-binding protein 2